MRVSTSSVYLTTARNLGTALSRVQDVSETLSSGKQIKAWSDDAPGATAASALRAQEADWGSFSRAAGDAKGWLDSSDGALQSMSTLLARVQSIAVGGLNGGLSADGREALAAEVDQLRVELRDLGQTRHLGRPLFAGFGEQALATAADGTISYAGDDASIRRQVSPTVVLPVNVAGRELFGFGGASPDVFATLAELSGAIRDADAGRLEDLQDRLQGHFTAVGRGLSKVGTTTNQVEAAQDAGSFALLGLAARRGELEDVDMAQAVLKLHAAEAGYSAALGAAARANLPSLADFLR